VQRVVRPNQQFRGYAGRVSSGQIEKGDQITVLPSGRTSTISNIVTFDGDLDVATFGQSVTLTLADEVDISRGDLIAAGDRLPETASSFEATIVWLNENPSELNRRYRLKHASRQEIAELKQLYHRVNINTLEREPASGLEMNAIGVVRVETARPIAFDSYAHNRGTGSFILVDTVTNATLAAGMITGAVAPINKASGAAKTQQPAGPVTAGERIARRGHIGASIRFGGRAGVAWRLERSLFDRGCAVVALDEVDEQKYQEVTRVLVQAGILVLSVGVAEQGFSVETGEGKTDNRVQSLPTSDTEAVDAVERLLERLQIIVQTPSESGGGI
jgi:sulfate adenylyltransferase subunit 1